MKDSEPLAHDRGSVPNSACACYQWFGANRMIYWLRRSSPTWLAQHWPEIRVLMKYPG